jgi:hypothetical protein
VTKLLRALHGYLAVAWNELRSALHGEPFDISLLIIMAAWFGLIIWIALAHSG